jgi:predicted tellurium resistance membrane protein TerC
MDVPLAAHAASAYRVVSITTKGGVMRFSIAAAALMLASTTAMAYQVTGPVLEVTDSKIVVEKDKEKWEIARDKDTKVSGDLKKGSRVTVQYRMTATSVDVKDAKDKDAKAKK